MNKKIEIYLILFLAPKCQTNAVLLHILGRHSAHFLSPTKFNFDKSNKNKKANKKREKGKTKKKF